MEPMISIIVPVYNIASYIDRCIESLLAQTYSKIEVILVNDGSTDNSGLVCDTWSCNKKIRVIHKANGGLSEARNIGIEMAKGEIISFIDGDDDIDTQMYEKLVKSMYENDADIAMCRIKRIENGQAFATREFITAGSSVVLTGQEAMKLLFLDKIDCSVCVKIFKKELFQDVCFPVGKTNEDFAVLYRLFYKCKRISYIEDTLYNYYYRDGSITKSTFNERQFDKIDNCLEMKEFIRNKIPNLITVANHYLLLQTMYLMKTMTIEKIGGYRNRYHSLRKIITINTLFILKSKYLTTKEKGIYLCLGWFPCLYRWKHANE